MNPENKAEVLSTLNKVRDLLTDPAKWTQNTSARNADGHEEIIESPAATCWCLYGAILKVRDPEGPAFGSEVTLDYLDDSLDMAIGRFNDTHTHAEVIQFLDKSISKLASEVA